MSRILVIDDNDLISSMLRDALTEHGFDVLLATDANQGFSQAVQFLPDLIMLDIQLPDITGFDLCRIIKNKPETRNIPIIMMTGTARSTEEKVKGFQMGIDDYLLKPFELPELLERVRAVLRRSESRKADTAVPAPALTISTPAPEPVATPHAPSRWLVQDALLMALGQPGQLPQPIFLPGISFFFLIAAWVLCFMGLWLSAGDKVSTALVGVSVIALWGSAVILLVMSATLMGVSLKWKEGAALVSLAGSPILLKLVSTVLFSFWTTLTPFAFSAGLPLLSSQASGWLARIDAYELWAAYLLFVFLSGLPQSSIKKSGILTGLVWLGTTALAAALGRVGG